MLPRALIGARLRPPVPLQATAARTFYTLRSAQNPLCPRRTSNRQNRARIPQNRASTGNASYPPPPQSNPPPAGLQAPVHIPTTVIQPSYLTPAHPAAEILASSALVVQRQLELGNLLLGFEQANKYVLMDPSGAHVGFLAEEESGIGGIVARQWFRAHRPFTAHIFDRGGSEVLRFSRPFSWISSRIGVFDPLVEGGEGRVIGEARQEWHMWRRRYGLFLYGESSGRGEAGEAGMTGMSENRTADGGYMKQFAYIDEPFLSWDFTLLSENNETIGSVNRNFAGFGRELFTDAGVYVLRMDAASVAEEPKHLISQTAREAPYRSLAGMGQADAVGRGMTLDERAVMLATAVSVDFDYFSKLSSGAGWGVRPYGMFWSEHSPISTSPVHNSTGVGGEMAGGMAGGAVGEIMGGVMRDPGGGGTGSASEGTTSTTTTEGEYSSDAEVPGSPGPAARPDPSPGHWGGGSDVGSSNSGDDGSWWPFDEEGQ